MSHSNLHELFERPHESLSLTLSSKNSQDSIELPHIICYGVVRLLKISCFDKYGELTVFLEAYKKGKVRIFVKAGETKRDYIEPEILEEYLQFLINVSQGG